MSYFLSGTLNHELKHGVCCCVRLICDISYELYTLPDDFFQTFGCRQRFYSFGCNTIRLTVWHHIILLHGIIRALWEVQSMREEYIFGKVWFMSLAYHLLVYLYFHSYTKPHMILIAVLTQFIYAFCICFCDAQSRCRTICISFYLQNTLFVLFIYLYSCCHSAAYE